MSVSSACMPIDIVMLPLTLRLRGGRTRHCEGVLHSHFSTFIPILDFINCLVTTFLEKCTPPVFQLTMLELIPLEFGTIQCVWQSQQSLGGGGGGRGET